MSTRLRVSKARTSSSSKEQQPTVAAHKDLPPAYTSSLATTATSINTLETHVTSITQQPRHPHQHPHPHQHLHHAASPEPVVAAPTFLQPRVAAVLGVSRPWHPVLFLLRLFSIVPSIYLGFPVAIRGLLMLRGLFTSFEELGPVGGGGLTSDDRLLLTETLLALMWCGCSGYLSFYFTDCLMSRW